MTDLQRFETARQYVDMPHKRYNIGTYKERTQHLLLKHFYEPDIAYHEVPYNGFVADILNNDGITEIQTAAFRALHGKLAVFLSELPVRIVYPVAQKKRIRWLDPETGEAFEGHYVTYSKAKYRLISELLSIVDFFGDKNLCVEIMLMSSTQYKLLDGYGADRKKRATKLDMVPEALLERIILRDASDVRKILPFSLGERLTAAEISSRLGLKKRALWSALKFLTVTEILCAVGKKGNSIIYEVTQEDQ